MPSQSLPSVVSAVRQLGAEAGDLSAVNKALCKVESEAGPSPEPSGILDRLPIINRCFGVNKNSTKDPVQGLVGVLNALENDKGDPEFSQQALKLIKRCRGMQVITFGNQMCGSASLTGCMVTAVHRALFAHCHRPLRAAAYAQYLSCLS